MTDKEKILAKIELLLNETNYEPYTDEVFGRIQSLKELKSYIDSLQEEPVSDDLEKAARNYSNNLDNIYSSIGEQTRKAFKAGAKWQRKQDQSTIELAEDHAMFAGMEKMREQMMKDAIPANILTNQYGNKYIQSWSGLKQYDKYKNGDKVKIIIIKKE